MSLRSQSRFKTSRGRVISKAESIESNSNSNELPDSESPGIDDFLGGRSDSSSSTLSTKRGVVIPQHVLSQMVGDKTNQQMGALVVKHDGINFYWGVPWLYPPTLRWIRIGALLVVIALVTDCSKFVLEVDQISPFVTICGMPLSVLNSFVGYLALRGASYSFLLLYALAESFMATFDLILIVAFGTTILRQETRSLSYSLFLAVSSSLITLTCVIVVTITCRQIRRDIRQLNERFPPATMDQVLDPQPFLNWYFGLSRPGDPQVDPKVDPQVESPTS